MKICQAFIISKYLFSPKLPLDEILTNFPFSIFPINEKFVRLSEKGTATLEKFISISFFY